MCIDHWAALVLEGEALSVCAVPEKEGSVCADGTFSAERAGEPGVNAAGRRREREV